MQLSREIRRQTKACRVIDTGTPYASGADVVIPVNVEGQLVDALVIDGRRVWQLVVSALTATRFHYPPEQEPSRAPLLPATWVQAEERFAEDGVALRFVIGGAALNLRLSFKDAAELAEAITTVAAKAI